MAYNITTTSGLTSYTITNGAINNQTNLSFIGKGSLNYGSSLNTNFLRLLENFADIAEPDSPIIGQIWWDTSTNNLRVYDGVEFGIVTPPLDRIASSTIGNLEIASSSITGEIVDGNINIGPNGTGNTVINRLAILNTGVGKVPYTAANGMIVTSTLSFNSTDNTLTATNLSATNIAGTLTTGPQAAITSVGTLENLTVAGNIATGNVITSGQHIGYLTGAIGANLANAGIFTTLTASSAAITGNATVGNLIASGQGGQVQGYFTGAIGANTANTGAFTTLTTTGNVGIGTSNPGYQLDVRKDQNSATVIRVLNASAGLLAQSIFQAQAGPSSYVNYLTSIAGTYNQIIGSGITNSYIDFDYQYFRTNSGTTNMTITPGGNVGIGTSSPTYPLVISRSAIPTYLYQSDGVGAQITGVNGAGLGISGTFSNTDMAIYSNSTEKIRIGANANVFVSGNLTVTGNISTTGSVRIDTPFFENSTTVAADYTIATGKNAGTFGPVTINSGVTVTIPSGSVWSVV